MEYDEFSKARNKWKADLTGQIFFSIFVFGTETFIAKKEQTDKKGYVVTLDISINDSEYILINR